MNYLAKIRLGVRAIERQTDALAPYVTKLNAGLAAIRDGLKAIDANLAGVDRGRVPSGARMSAGAAMVPDAVYTIWWIGLIVTLVVFVPLAVYSLHRTWRSARSIQRYAAETLQAAAGIARQHRATSARWTPRSRSPPRCWVRPAPSRGKLDTVAGVLEATDRLRRRRCCCP